MKTLLVTLSVALAGVGSAQAQIFRPSVGTGAVVGAVAGGLIGGHNGDRWAEGAIIGAAAGALIGAAVAPQEPVYTTPPPVYQPPVYGQQVYRPAPIGNAPTVPNAPVIVDNVPTQVVQAAPQVVQVPPQVVYVQPAPQVVYVSPAPRVVYAPPPVVSIGVYSGPRRYVPPPRVIYREHYRPGHGHYRR